MALKYKINILSALKDAGYNTNKIRKEKLLSEGTLQSLRNGKYISMNAIDKICRLLECQPSDLLEYTKEDEQAE
ncbi:MAG: helix-turn-helix transcriptional regulator [Ruminococcus sp.]|nr:helix-turn-helix transcriptional regulator [Ruminococcus sp.]